MGGICSSHGLSPLALWALILMHACWAWCFSHCGCFVVVGLSCCLLCAVSMCLWVCQLSGTVPVFSLAGQGALWVPLVFAMGTLCGLIWDVSFFSLFLASHQDSGTELEQSDSASPRE